MKFVEERERYETRKCGLFRVSAKFLPRRGVRLQTAGVHGRRVKTISRRVYARMKTQGQLKEGLNKPESLSFPLHLPGLKRSTA